MKTTISRFLLVTLGLLLGIADSSSQVWKAYTYEQLLGQTVVSNALFAAPLTYADLMRRVTTNKVSENLSPVHLYSCANDRFDWLASGTHFRENNKDYIVTSGHIFSKDRGPKLVFYRKVQEKDARFYGISLVFDSHRVTRDNTTNPRSELDVATALHGPALAIQPFSDLEREVTQKTSFAYLTDTNLVLTSLLDGKKYRPLSVGMVGTPTNFTYKFLVFDYRATNGESGSGFLGSDGFLYVLMGSFLDNEENRNDFKKAGITYTNGLARAMMMKIGKQ